MAKDNFPRSIPLWFIAWTRVAFFLRDWFGYRPSKKHIYFVARHVARSMNKRIKKERGE